MNFCNSKHTTLTSLSEYFSFTQIHHWNSGCAGFVHSSATATQKIPSKSITTRPEPQSITTVCHDTNQTHSRSTALQQTIDSMLNKMSPEYATIVSETVQPCKTHREWTEKKKREIERELRACLWQTSVRYCLCLASGIHEELMRLLSLACCCVLQGGAESECKWAGCCFSLPLPEQNFITIYHYALERKKERIMCVRAYCMCFLLLGSHAVGVISTLIPGEASGHSPHAGG